MFIYASNQLKNITIILNNCYDARGGVQFYCTPPDCFVLWYGYNESFENYFLATNLT